MLDELIVEGDCSQDPTTTQTCLPTEIDITCLFGGREMLTMGNRPQDHRARDLSLGSLLRDYRTRLFRRYCAGQSNWTVALPAGWPKEFSRQGHQLIVLGSMQQHFLDRLRVSIPLDDDGQAARMLDAMEDCMPLGALFERRDEDDHRRHCGYSKLCPWCHARSVERIYRRLSEGPCAAARLEGKKLVLARMNGGDAICGGGSVLRRGEVQNIRGAGRETARSIADDLELDGGIVFCQFGPKRVYGPRGKVVGNAFSCEITMIGESTGITPVKVRECESSGYDVLLLPADTPQALRYLLFGTSYKFPVERIEGVTGGAWFTKYGIPGAASLQFWFLFNETQAWSYVTATAGTRLCNTFGTWRKNGRPAVQRKAEDSDRERLPREQVLRNTNNERKYEAANRRAGLMPKAKQVFRKLRSEMGRNPGSTALRSALAVAGHAISDRDSRWLAKQLPLSYGGESKPFLA
jgi:hypothetical protein